MTIQKIAIYSDACQLGQEQLDDFENIVDSDRQDYLAHMNDFEPFQFAVIDGAVYVYDRLSDDVVGSYQTAQEFIDDCLLGYEEE